MADILVLYFSRNGKVRALAQCIAQGIDGVPGAAARLRTVPPVAPITQTASPPVPDSGAPYVEKRDLAECIGLALGSGSARGWAHIGILQALAEHGLRPDVITGASVGALLGFTTAGAVACLWNLHRCVSASQNQLDACLDQECPGASHVDVGDCADIGSQDFKDCAFSCGADMPDGDEEDACVRAFTPPGPLPAPGPGGFTPPGGPDGGLFGECNGANADACDAGDTLYTDSNGDIVDVDCTFYTLDDPTRSDDCYCQCSEVRAKSSEVEFLPE